MFLSFILLTCSKRWTLVVLMRLFPFLFLSLFIYFVFCCNLFLLLLATGILMSFHSFSFLLISKRSFSYYLSHIFLQYEKDLSIFLILLLWLTYPDFDVQCSYFHLFLNNLRFLFLSFLLFPFLPLFLPPYFL